VTKLLKTKENNPLFMGKARDHEMDEELDKDMVKDIDDDIDKETKGLIEQAENVYKNNFPNTTWFERAVFYSWSCKIRDCKFCYMSTRPEESKNEGVRSEASILAETLIIRELGWKFAMLSGGYGVLSEEKLIQLIRNINTVMGEKIWLNIGVINNPMSEKLFPYIQGIVGSTETVDKELHDALCPSKPLEPIEKMFERNITKGIKNGMTFIIGMGETKKDFTLLEKFIRRYKIERIHLYSLNPHPGTIFEHKPLPKPEYQAWWIAKTRMAFPTIDIQCGIWDDKVEDLSLLLRAGANSISKYPAIRRFNSSTANKIETEAKKAKREFKGSLTTMPEVDWDEKVAALQIDEELKQQIKKKLDAYLKTMSRKK
jgi:biotin synthase-like enzyme